MNKDKSSCVLCNSSYSISHKKRIISEFSQKFKDDSKDLCLNCISEQISINRSSIYKDLADLKNSYEFARDAYYKALNEYENASNLYKSLDRHYHLISHNIKIDKDRRNKKASKIKKISKTKELTQAEIESMLANLTFEQRQTVMANFK